MIYWTAKLKYWEEIVCIYVFLYTVHTYLQIKFTIKIFTKKKYAHLIDSSDKY